MTHKKAIEAWVYLHAHSDYFNGLSPENTGDLKESDDNWGSAAHQKKAREDAAGFLRLWADAIKEKEEKI